MQKLGMRESSSDVRHEKGVRDVDRTKTQNTALSLVTDDQALADCEGRQFQTVAEGAERGRE